MRIAARSMPACRELSSTGCRGRGDRRQLGQQPRRDDPLYSGRGEVQSVTAYPDPVDRPGEGPVGADQFAEVEDADGVRMSGRFLVQQGVPGVDAGGLVLAVQT